MRSSTEHTTAADDGLVEAGIADHHSGNWRQVRIGNERASSAEATGVFIDVQQHSQRYVQGLGTSGDREREMTERRGSRLGIRRAAPAKPAINDLACGRRERPCVLVTERSCVETGVLQPRFRRNHSKAGRPNPAQQVTLDHGHDRLVVIDTATRRRSAASRRSRGRRHQEHDRQVAARLAGDRLHRLHLVHRQLG